MIIQAILKIKKTLLSTTFWTMFWYPPFQNHQFVCQLHVQNFPMNYPPIYLCDTLAFNLNELIMQDFANAVETVSKMKDLSSCRVFLVNSAAFHKYERHCHTFIFFHVEISSILVTMKQTSSFKNHSCHRTHFSIQSSKCFSSINLFPSFHRSFPWGRKQMARKISPR